MSKKFFVLSAIGVAGATIVQCVGDSSNAEDGGIDAAPDTTLPVDAAQIDAGNDVDAAIPPMCDLTKPFNTPVMLTPPIDGPGSRTSLWFSADQLTAWFNSNLTADGGTQMLSNMYSTSRTALDAGFADAAPLTAINAVGTGYGAGGAVITADGLTMYFGNGTLGTYATWLATRSNVDQQFVTVSELGAPINAGGENEISWLSPDGGTMYFMSNRSGGTGGRDIWTSARGADGGFTTPAPLLGVNTTSDDAAIVLTPDELQAFVERNDDSVYYTSRPNTGVQFPSPQAVSELNTFAAAHGKQIYPSFASADGCTLYFSCGSPSQIYSATRGM